MAVIETAERHEAAPLRATQGQGQPRRIEVTVVLKLSQYLLIRLREDARRRGLSVERWFSEMVDVQLAEVATEERLKRHHPGLTE